MSSTSLSTIQSMLHKLVSEYNQAMDSGYQGPIRGKLADLRRGLSKATEAKAWCHIVPYCNVTDSREKAIALVLAAGLATHLNHDVSPHLLTSDSYGNLGESMRKIALEGGSDANHALATFRSRFERLLTCATAVHVCELLPGILKTAAVKGVPVNYCCLAKDLWYWNERTKLSWAASFWKSAEKITEDLAT